MQWITAQGPGPCGRRGNTLTPLDENRLLLFGGTTRTASFNDLYLFDAVSGELFYPLISLIKHVLAMAL